MDGGTSERTRTCLWIMKDVEGEKFQENRKKSSFYSKPNRKEPGRLKWINTRSQWFSGLKSPFPAVSLNYYRMDRHMDGRMNGQRTDTAAYRNVRTHLKIQRRTEQPCLKLVGHLDPRHHLWTKSCYKVTEASSK